MSERLFFALWPEPHVRSAITTLQGTLLTGVLAQPQGPDQLHVTLVFLGEVAASLRAGVALAAGHLSASPFEIVFDAVEHWRRPKVLSLTASSTPAALTALVSDLQTELARAEVTCDPRKFRPHVTLARKVTNAFECILTEPVVWRADRFALVRSVTHPAGSRYEPLQWWNLGVEAH